MPVIWVFHQCFRHISFNPDPAQYLNPDPGTEDPLNPDPGPSCFLTLPGIYIQLFFLYKIFLSKEVI